MNQHVLDHLLGLYERGTLGHAYIFAGPLGIGKFETARALAKRANCFKGGSGSLDCDCASCLKIDSQNHPDVFVLEKPEDKTGIGIDQVRVLIERFEFHALEARLKVAIVKDADLIHEGAANAFLKTLEEPKPATVLILTTALPDALLSTITSRCQLMRFPAMPLKALEGVLCQQHGFKDLDATLLAAFSQGSLGRALTLGGDFLNRRQVVVDAFLTAADPEALIKVAGMDRERAHEALGIILMLLKDGLMMSTGALASLVNLDRQVELRRFAGRYNAQELASFVDQVSDAMRRLQGHQNVKVVLTVVKEMQVA